MSEQDVIDDILVGVLLAISGIIITVFFTVGA